MNNFTSRLNFTWTMIKVNKVAPLVTWDWSISKCWRCRWINATRSWMESSWVPGFSNCVPVGCHTEVEPSVAFWWRYHPSHPEGEGSLNLRSQLESFKIPDWDGSMITRRWMESSWILQILKCITLGCQIEVEPIIALYWQRYWSHPGGNGSMLPGSWLESPWLLWFRREALQKKPWANFKAYPPP